MHSIHAFAEKVALVTGASGPIGRAVSMQLALLGAFVIGADDTGAEPHRELVSLGTLAASVDADVATAAGARTAVAEADKMFGRVDILVNCLKMPSESSFFEIGETELADSFTRSLSVPLIMTQAAFGLMSPRPKARIVNVLPPRSSESAGPAVVMAKEALRGLTAAAPKSLPGHFRFNSVIVEGVSAVTSGELFEERSGVLPDDAARAVLFLLSSESTAINGQTIIVG